MVHFDNVDNLEIIVFRIEFNTVPQKNKELITIILSSNKIFTMSQVILIESSQSSHGTIQFSYYPNCAPF